MKMNIDLKKEWEKTKKQLEKFSQEAVVIAKKGEEELVKFSQKGKLHLDSTAIGLKIEQLYYAIGKEYVTSAKTNKPSAQLNNYVAQIQKLEKEQKSLKSRIKRSSGSTQSAKRK